MCICAHMCASRYVGVDMGNGMYDRDAVVSGDSNIAFEWCFQSAGSGVRRDIVTPRVNNAAKRGVPAPDCTRKTRAALADLERFATEAAASALGQLQERLGWPGMNEVPIYPSLAL